MQIQTSFRGSEQCSLRVVNQTNLKTQKITLHVAKAFNDAANQPVLDEAGSEGRGCEQFQVVNRGEIWILMV